MNDRKKHNNQRKSIGDGNFKQKSKYKRALEFDSNYVD